MHRSGTSLLTKIIAENGYYPGWKLEENSEPTFLIKMNDLILQAAGVGWENPYSINEFLTEVNVKCLADWLAPQLIGWRSLELFGPMKWMCRRKMLNSDGIMLKDPRTSLTLPVWKLIFPNLRVIHISRHGIDVAESLRCRAHNIYVSHKYGKGVYPRGLRVLDINSGVNLWDFYESNCLAEIKKLEVGSALSLKYEDLLTEPERVLGEVSVFLGGREMSFGSTEFDESRAWSYRRDKHLVAVADRHREVLVKNGY